MTPQQIVGFAARLFAIWLVVTVMPDLWRAFVVTQQTPPSGDDAGIWALYVMAALYLAAILALWFCPMVIAHKLIPRTRFQDTLRLPARQAMTVACVVLGLSAIVLQALPMVTAYVVVIAICIASGQPITTLSDVAHSRGIIGCTQLVVGALLVFKAHALTGWIIPLAASPSASPAERTG